MSSSSPDVRRAVFERDDYACRHCGANGDRDRLTSRCVGLSDRVEGGVSLDGVAERGDKDAHESALVTVCPDCVSVLEGRVSPLESRRDLFETVRETIETQGSVIADVAAFAALATSLTESLERDETRAYPAARRDTLLGIGVVDARLERLEGGASPKLETETTDGENGAIVSALDAFSETAAELQTELRETVELAETAAEGHDRCRICFEPLESGAGPCGACGGRRLEGSDWRDGDGNVRFVPLVSAINEGLQRSSETTAALTDRATRLAEKLVD